MWSLNINSKNNYIILISGSTLVAINKLNHILSGNIKETIET